MKDYTSFIEKHVVTELVKQGYEQSVALKGADRAVDHYRCRDVFEVKNGMV